MVWLSYLQTRPAHALSSSSVLSRPQMHFQDCFVDPPVFRAGARPPERVASHDFSQPLCVSDCSIVSSYCSCPFLCADLLDCLVQYCVAPLWWLQLHRQVPAAKCRREINLWLGFRIKAENLPLRSKTDHRPQSVISVTAFSGRLQLTLRLSMTVGLPDSSKVHKILFSWVIHYLCLQCCTRIRVRNLCE